MFNSKIAAFLRNAKREDREAATPLIVFDKIISGSHGVKWEEHQNNHNLNNFNSNWDVLLPEPMQSFAERIEHVFIDHSPGNIKVYKLSERRYIFAYKHCEHNDTRDIVWLAGLIEELELDVDIILWDGYWEKLLLDITIPKDTVDSEIWTGV